MELPGWCIQLKHVWSGGAWLTAGMFEFSFLLVCAKCHPFEGWKSLTQKQEVSFPEE